MSELSNAADLLRQITESAGSSYLDRAHQRSFSLNVFQMNAVELVEAIQRVKDPGQGMVLMMEKNKEAGHQAHRELSRHVHNFVSSALTLVEHTRIFMRKHYAGTELLAFYEKQVTVTFAHSPVAQFVQGLRNYMLHRSLPSSSMFMKLTTNPGATDGSATAETGVHYDTASLLDWKEWRPTAKAYLENAGEHLDLHEFAHEYLTLVNQFHGWLDTTLLAHHQSDLQKLSQLQAQLQAMGPTERPVALTSIEASDSATIEPFEFTPAQTNELIQLSCAVLGQIRELEFQSPPQGFPTERPTITITDSELIGPITFWGNDVSGGRAFAFIQREGKSFGLSESDYRSVDRLIGAAMKSTWARLRVSRAFIEKTFIEWARLRFLADGWNFPEAMSAAARESVAEFEVWAPIANLEVEQGFEFGPVRIEPITAAAMEYLQRRAPPARPEQEQQVSQLFDKLRHDIQGFAAVVVAIEAESSFVKERALRIAQDVVGLLRFFSPAAPRSFLFSPVALKGAEYIPTAKLISLHDAGFSLTEGLLPKQVGFWRLSREQIGALKSGAMDAAASLVMPDDLNDFALAVRASLLCFSKGTTLVDSLDRLRSCISAIEEVLLKHEMEPRAHSVANRMSLILAHVEADRETVKQVVRQAYWLKDQPTLTAQGRGEDELIAFFTSYAHDVLQVALRNVASFGSKIQFVIDVDRLGFPSR